MRTLKTALSALLASAALPAAQLALRRRCRGAGRRARGSCRSIGMRS